MKKLALAMACLFAVGVAQADDKGGFSQDAAPPPPHKLDDGYRGVEDGRIMTVEQAKTMHDGATVSLRGNLLKRQGDDRYQFRDKSGTITVIIPVANLQFDRRYEGNFRCLNRHGSDQHQ